MSTAGNIMSIRCRDGHELVDYRGKCDVLSYVAAAQGFACKKGLKKG